MVVAKRGCACEQEEPDEEAEEEARETDPSLDEGFLLFGNQSVSQSVKSENEENKITFSLDVDKPVDDVKSERIDQNKHSDAPFRAHTQPPVVVVVWLPGRDCVRIAGITSSSSSSSEVRPVQQHQQ